MESYFKTVPCIKWTDWIFSFLPFTETEPSHFAPLQTPPRLISQTGTLPQRAPATIEQARELSTFLSQHYYEPSSPYLLVIPPRKLAELLQTGVIALTLRDSQKRLIACIFEFPMGSYKTSCGLITWLCVHPNWRKRGIANLLYWTISYWTTGAAKLKWFRNDALFQSPIPPVCSQTMMVRAIRTERSARSYAVRQINMTAHDIQMIERLWKQKYPTGMFISPGTTQQTILQCWIYQKGPSTMYALVQPTFEITKQDAKQSCEIVTIVCEGFKDTYEETHAFEQLVDSLPWDRCEAPAEIPHIKSFWTVGGTSAWSVVGLHPGRPFQRPVVSLLAA